MLLESFLCYMSFLERRKSLLVKHNHLMYCKPLLLVLLSFFSGLWALCHFLAGFVFSSLSLIILRDHSSALFIEWFYFLEGHIKIRTITELKPYHHIKSSLFLVCFKINRSSAYILYIAIKYNLLLTAIRNITSSLLLSKHGFPDTNLNLTE